jgi:hypothetical protein
MKISVKFLLCTLLIGFLHSCKKDEQPEPEPTAFTYTAADSLIFEHTGTLPYAVAVQSTSGKEFISSFSGLGASFLDGGTTLTIPSNQSRSFDIYFNQVGANPGVYPCTLSVAVPNQNNAVKTKIVQMVYRPNCGYPFRNYTFGEITYQINGLLENRAITCLYNSEGQLEVDGLVPFQINLNFNCSNATVTMDPVLHLGNVVTCTGAIEGTEVALQFFNDGVYNAVGRIKF